MISPAFQLASSSSYWNPHGDCPRLFLAPMEGLNDRAWRKAYSSIIGGFDEACTEFIRMPKEGHAASLAKSYDPGELGKVPLAVQIMGENPLLCASLAYELELKGAKRIDLNCGCPSNTVVGKGAGSSLLKSPELVYAMASAIKKAVSIPVSIKMRAGYEDESLFEQNLLAAQSAGCCWITLHPRTKVDGYRGKARWLLVAQAKSLLSIPVIASGDVTNAQSALDLHALTGCDGIMIGRGAFIDPWIFYRVRAAFLGLPCTLNLQIQRQQLKDLFHFFLGELQNYSESGKLGRLKQVCRFLMQGHPKIQLPFKALLSQQLSCSEMIEVMSSNYEAL